MFRLGKHYLTAYVAASIVLANIFVTKQMKLFSLDATSGKGMLYGSIFLATDLLSEHFRAERQRYGENRFWPR